MNNSNYDWLKPEASWAGYIRWANMPKRPLQFRHNPELMMARHWRWLEEQPPPSHRPARRKSNVRQVAR